MDNPDGYYCVCSHPYVGPNCEFHVCGSTKDIICHNGGTCIQEDVTCICRPGYEGLRCEQDMCKEIICLNGGICEMGKCQCPDGFKGKYL